MNQTYVCEYDYAINDKNNGNILAYLSMSEMKKVYIQHKGSPCIPNRIRSKHLVVSRLVVSRKHTKQNKQGEMAQTSRLKIHELCPHETLFQ